MTLAALTPQAYYDPQVFERERCSMFRRLWIFAGLANEIPRSNDYFRVEVAGVDVIVQNGGGQLRAFVNSCSHRHARIHEEARGNRRLICPYHGWSYDEAGVPHGVPGDTPEGVALRGGVLNFPEVRADPGRFALRQLELECAGHFIFVRIQPGGPGLREHLGPAWDFLSGASTGLDACADEFTGSLAANWKVAIENALEGYHVPMIHGATLQAISQFSRAPDDIVDHLPDSGHSYMINRANDDWMRKWKRFDAQLGSWPFKFDHYVHQLVFPNLTVTSFMGYSFHIQRFHPEAAGRTSVHSRIYSVRTEGQTERGKRIMKTVYAEGKAFSHKVFAEDRRACELAYQGIQQARPHSHALLADVLEKRVAHFQATYVHAMEKEAQ